MSIDDYLLEQRDHDWAALLSDWADVLPAVFTLRLVNRFGDLIIVLEDGRVHLFDVGTGTMRQIAPSRGTFAKDIDGDDNASEWLLIPLVDRCVAAGMLLACGQCYAFKIPPLLGGKYDLDNVYVGSLEAYYSFLADLHRQTKHLPDGAQVRLVVKP